MINGAFHLLQLPLSLIRSFIFIASEMPIAVKMKLLKSFIK